MSSAEPTRRDFLYIATGAVAAVGTAAALVPLIAQMNPDASTVAAGAPVEIDLAPIAAGQIVKVFWRSQPIFISHRTQKEIDEARAVDTNSLRDPQSDESRVSRAVTSGWSSSASAPISAASRSPIRATTTAGSVPATDRNTIHRVASGRVQRR